MWPLDRTRCGARLRAPDALERVLVWPKLYRRLHRFFRSGLTDLRAFPPWLRTDARDANDRVRIAGSGLETRIHDLVRMTRTTIRMEERVENIVMMA